MVWLQVWRAGNRWTEGQGGWRTEWQADWRQGIRRLVGAGGCFWSSPRFSLPCQHVCLWVVSQRQRGLTGGTSAPPLPAAWAPKSGQEGRGRKHVGTDSVSIAPLR